MGTFVKGLTHSLSVEKFGGSEETVMNIGNLMLPFFYPVSQKNRAKFGRLQFRKARINFDKF